MFFQAKVAFRLAGLLSLSCLPKWVPGNWAGRLIGRLKGRRQATEVSRDPGGRF